MATRCVIARKISDGVQAIYCHWSGYPEYTGHVLSKYYQTQEARDALFALGDLSSIGASPFTPPAGHSIDQPIAEFCVAYGRDGGEIGTEAKIFTGLQSVCNAAQTLYGADFIYYHDGEQWVFAPLSYDRYGVFRGEFTQLAG